jgi:hypothetical protein
VQNQFDNLKNSKLEGAPREAAPVAEWLVWAVIALVAGAVLWSASALPQPLSGRLHPAHAPMAMAALCLGVAALGVATAASRARADRSPAGCEAMASSPRAIVAAVVAVAILALATRTAGVLPAVFAAGFCAALGVRGARLMPALFVGAGLAALSALLFVAILRQPLPLLPGVW